ncbi:MAG: hypothetical protein EZS28_024397 [Streblomastix strix]|uniref:Right handed beta helix domain-containing protein n=1 Tax=Streblomastix strix TaxID=222440 RepID=A0A5J4VBZ7_9EUKA|nr:MAG: hypothetical protein EZS28_024397 [Streblomastix strix]
MLSCNFIECTATDSGGALYIQIGSGAESTLRNISFDQCEFQYNGGAVYAYLESNGKLTISGSSLFSDCKTLSDHYYAGGGGLYVSLSGEKCQLTIEGSITFDGCLANIGGGMYIKVGNNSQLLMTGLQIYKDCNSSSDGGGCCVLAYESNNNINLLGKMQFEGCRTQSNGGGLYLSCLDVGQITINDMSFSNCNSMYGGGFYSDLDSGVQMTITGKVAFNDCNSIIVGGGQYLHVNGSNIIVNITGELEYKQCNAQYGGGLYADIFDNTLVEINKSTFKQCTCNNIGGGMYVQVQRYGQLTISINTRNCNSSQRGGGLYAFIAHGGKLILDKSCEFYQCNSGLGGGIYVWINLTAKCSFIIKDAYFHECVALNSTNSSLQYPYSGFGGGIFLGTFKDYDPKSELIDLRGMKIYNNSADKYGQSLFVAMIKIEEFCKYGTQGEYAKGNYSDTYSNETDLYGIPMDLFTFFYATPETIQQQSQPLEPWWRILGILKRAQITVNISNPNGKLIFHIEGQRMVPGYLNVKIFELRDKTQENINQEQKGSNYKFNKNNLKSIKQTSSQSSIIISKF